MFCFAYTSIHVYVSSSSYKLFIKLNFLNYNTKFCKQEYLKFLEEFGTHVVGEIWYGSKYTLNSELTEEAAKSMQASGQSAAYSAKISLMGKFGMHNFFIMNY